MKHGVTRLMFSIAAFAAVLAPFAAPPRAAAAQPPDPHEVAEAAPDARPSDERAFEEVKKLALDTGNESHLWGYLTNNPGSRFAEEARLTIDRIQYAPARGENSPKAYSNFIATFPNNRFREEAGVRAEELMFSPFAEIGTIDSYNNFLESFPGSRFAAVARAAVEDLVFDGVKKANSVIGYAEFLRDYPESARGPEAVRLKEDLEYAAYAAADVEKGYAEFLWANPVNHNRAEAQKRHDELRAVRVKEETDAICAEAKNTGKYNCDYVSYGDGTLLVKIIKLGEVTQGQQLLMGGPGYLEEIERRYRDWKQETIKRLLRILGVMTVTVE